MCMCVKTLFRMHMVTRVLWFSLDAVTHFQMRLKFYAYWSCDKKLNVNVSIPCQFVTMVCFNCNKLVYECTMIFSTRIKNRESFYNSKLRCLMH